MNLSSYSRALDFISINCAYDYTRTTGKLLIVHWLFSMHIAYCVLPSSIAFTIWQLQLQFCGIFVALQDNYQQ